MRSRRGLLAGAGAAAVALAGGRATLVGSNGGRFDWPMAGYDAAGTAHGPDAAGPKGAAEIAWRRNPNAGVHGRTPPILVGGTLYAVGRRGLVAFDRDTGDVRFVRGGRYRSAPTRVPARAYRSDTLAVAGRDGIYGLSATGGYELFGRSVGTERWHAPGEDTGAWSGSSPREPSPVAADGTVYAIDPGTNRVVAIDASSGRLEWTHVVGDPRSIGSNRPAVREGTVYVSSRPGDLVALDAETGERRWSERPTPHADSPLGYREFRPPTATEAGLLVPDREGVALFDPIDGSVRWEYVHGGDVADGSAAVADGTAFVIGENALHAIDIETGDREWTADHRADATPVVADGVVYLGDRYGELVAIDAGTGERRFTYEGTSRFSQPIVGDGVLYALTDEGLLALEEAS